MPDPITPEQLAAIRERDADMPTGRDGLLTPRTREHDRRLLLAEVDRLTAELAAGRAEIDDELRKAGIEYPLGVRGVHDLAMQRDLHLDRAEEAERELAVERAKFKRLATLHQEDDGWCEECGYGWPCQTVRALTAEPEADRG